MQIGGSSNVYKYGFSMVVSGDPIELHGFRTLVSPGKVI